MKLRKIDASDVAVKLLEEKYTKIAELKKELYNETQSIAEQSVPHLIKDCFKKFPGFFKTASKLFANEHTYYFEKEVPCDAKKCHWAITNISSSDAKRLWNMNTTIEKLEKKTDDLHTDIVNTLMTLGTYKRIQAEFPEAAPHLPTPKTTALAINVKDIVKRING